MNKYFIGISEPGEDFSGNKLTEELLKYQAVVVVDGQFIANPAFATLIGDDYSNVSLLKTIEKETFVELVRRMRQHQKDFFTSKPGTAFKQESLQKARAYEKEVDLVLAAMDNTQLKMSL